MGDYNIKRDGFTIIEFTMLLIILGIVTAVALPRFVDLKNQAQGSRDDKIIGAVQSGLVIYGMESVTRGRSPTYPSALDNASASFASPANPFFANALQPPGVTIAEWNKLSNVLYKTPSEEICYYNSGEGTFGKIQLLSRPVLDTLGISNQDITADLLLLMQNDNTVTFDTGQTLVGGAAVLTPRPGNEPTLQGQETGKETFSFGGNALNIELINEYAGYGPYLTFGYYVKDPTTGAKSCYELFNGAAGAGATASFTPSANSIVGFYLTTPEAPGYIYYSESSANPDGKDHMRIYENMVLKKITMGCEDLYGGGDKDFQDFIVTISY